MVKLFDNMVLMYRKAYYRHLYSEWHRNTTGSRRLSGFLKTVERKTNWSPSTLAHVCGCVANENGFGKYRRSKTWFDLPTSENEFY